LFGRIQQLGAYPQSAQPVRSHLLREVYHVALGLLRDFLPAMSIESEGCECQRPSADEFRPFESPLHYER
jgi:hypothetical protein